MGRPQLKIDAKQILNYASLGASNRDIADLLGCDEGTIRKRFSAELTKGRANRKNELRQMQWDAAKSGNVTMLIWLGKNDLGQKDQQDVVHEGAIKIEVVYKQPTQG